VTHRTFLRESRIASIPVALVTTYSTYVISVPVAVLSGVEPYITGHAPVPSGGWVHVTVFFRIISSLKVRGLWTLYAHVAVFVFTK